MKVINVLLILMLVAIPLAIATDPELPEECDGADVQISDDMWVVGDGCHHSGHIYDSRNFDAVEPGFYRLIVESERGVSGPQFGESFVMAVNGVPTPESLDDADYNAHTVRVEDMGVYELQAGDNLLEMFTITTCPPHNDPASVDATHSCFWKEGDIPVFPGFSIVVALVVALAGVFLLRKR